MNGWSNSHSWAICASSGYKGPDGVPVVAHVAAGPSGTLTLKEFRRHFSIPSSAHMQSAVLPFFETHYRLFPSWLNHHVKKASPTNSNPDGIEPSHVLSNREQAGCQYIKVTHCYSVRVTYFLCLALLVTLLVFIKQNRREWSMTPEFTMKTEEWWIIFHDHE